MITYIERLNDMDNLERYIKGSFLTKINNSFLIKRMRKIKVFESFLKFFLLHVRRKQALLFLKNGNIYPYDIDSVICDYIYSIKITYRTIHSVINIESIVREVFRKKINGAFVEAGTYTGGASAFALLSLMRNFKDKNLPNYWGFDSFEGMPSPSFKDGINAFKWLNPNLSKVNIKMNKSVLIGSHVNLADYNQCLDYLRNTNYPSLKINLVKGWFQDTLKMNKKNIGKIAILRIDGDFYDSTLCVLDELYDNVSKGGVIILDDYGNFEGSRKATHFFFKKKKIKPFLHYVDSGIRYFIKP
jgi:hypothetical protein